MARRNDARKHLVGNEGIDACRGGKTVRNRAKSCAGKAIISGRKKENRKGPEKGREWLAVRGDGQRVARKEERSLVTRLKMGEGREEKKKTRI